MSDWIDELTAQLTAPVVAAWRVEPIVIEHRDEIIAALRAWRDQRPAPQPPGTARTGATVETAPPPRPVESTTADAAPGPEPTYELTLSLLRGIAISMQEQQPSSVRHADANQLMLLADAWQRDRADAERYRCVRTAGAW